jgi:hypothetical protein
MNLASETSLLENTTPLPSSAKAGVRRAKFIISSPDEVELILNSFHEIDCPFLICYDLVNTKIYEGLFKDVARDLLHLVLDSNYLTICEQRIVFLVGHEGAQDAAILTAGEFRKLGIRNLKFAIIDPELLHISNIEGAELPFGEVNFEQDSEISVFLKSLKWVLYHMRNEPSVVRQLRLEIVANSDVVKTLNANYAFKRHVEILERNLFDLDKYYRYVRGETTFNHHNRPKEEGVADIPSTIHIHQPNPGLVNGTVMDPGEIVKINRYKDQYEILPSAYKRLGTVLKIFSGRSPMLRHLSKRHKTAFIDFINLLPEEKRIEVWYYYEYEILPAWYKKIGRWLANRMRNRIT